MQARTVTTMFVTLLLLAAARTALAGERVALVIGNSAYRHTAPLPTTRHDATKMTLALERSGLRVIRGIDLDRQGMERILRRYVDALDGAELGLVFYAGHGLQARGENYLVPVDARLEDPLDVEFERLPLERIIALTRRNAASSVVMLDAARENPLARRLERTMEAAVDQGLAPLRPPARTVVVLSAAPGTTVTDTGDRHSPFTRALSGELSTPGLELPDLLRRVGKEVRRLTGGRQVPGSQSSLSALIVLTPERPRLTAAPSVSSTSVPEPPPAPAPAEASRPAIVLRGTVNRPVPLSQRAIVMLTPPRSR